MTSPQGWYPDPAGGAGLRWYDGAQWTEHLAAPASAHYPGAVVGGPDRTPDGAELASWGSRLGAYLLDSLLVGVLGGLLSLPFLLDAIETYFLELDAAMDAAATGSQTSTEVLDLYAWSGGSFLMVVLIGQLVGLVYHVAQLRVRGSTLGMRAVGIEVRTRDPRSGQLPWRVVLVRWATFYGVGILSVVPFLGWLVSPYVLLAGLWPLWDARRQGLHDKAAGTVVVRSRA